MRAKEIARSRDTRLPVLVLAPMPRTGVLRLCAALPLERLAWKDSGLGRADTAFPPTFCPIQIAVAVGFRLRNMGWPVEFQWPAGLLIQSGRFGAVHCEKSRGWLFAEAAFSLSRDPGAVGREDALVIPFHTSLANHRPCDPEAPGPLDLLPTLLHGILNALESPWPRPLTLNFYNRWCVDLGKPHEHRLEDGTALKGIAREVTDEGSLIVESDGGEILHVPLEIHGDGVR